MSGGYSEPLETGRRRSQGSGELPGEVGVSGSGGRAGERMSGVGYNVSSRAWGTVRTLEPPHILPRRSSLTQPLQGPFFQVLSCVGSAQCGVRVMSALSPFPLPGDWVTLGSGEGQAENAENLGLGVTAFDPLLQIADFGLSNLYYQGKFLQTFCGSPLYASPEIVNGKPYTGPEVSVHPLLPACLIHFL